MVRSSMLLKILIKIIAESIIEYLAIIDESKFKENKNIQKLMLRLSNTPTLFGGDWDRVKFGKNVKIVNALLNVSSGEIEIGDHTFFGHNVLLLTGSHNLKEKYEKRQEYPVSGRDIIIGKGVWIASNAIIIGPCIIEDHVVVGAGAVVVGGVLKAGHLYGGIPAKQIKRIG